MEDYSKVYKTIKTEVTQDSADVRDCYLKQFGDQVANFIEGMSHAFLNWRALDNSIHGDEKRALVSALAYNAITLHVLSMKLFLSGYIVAAGNMQRQVLETIALASLCSCKQLDVLEGYMADKYSTSNAVRDVLKHADKLNFKRDALKVLKQARDFYHHYSHPTLLTIAAQASLTEQGLYVGTSYDEGKLEQYEKEITGRVSLADIFSNFVDGIKANIGKW